MNSQPIQLSREELYARVWSRPISELAPTFGLSDRGLEKICERHRIPRPPRGYWRRVATGKRPKPKPLPRLFLDEAALASITIRPTPVPERSDETPRPGDFRAEIEARPENRIEVPERVGRYHPLVQRTRKAFGNQRSGVMEPHDGGVSPPLDVRVDAKNRHRALLILDTLIKALERRGFTVQSRKHKIHGKPETVVVVDGMELAIRLRERYRLLKLAPEERGVWDYPKVRREMTGELVLEILWCQHRPLQGIWSDGKGRRLEELLNEVVVGLDRAADAKRRWLQEREEDHRRQEAEAAARRERQRLADLEEARRQEFRRQAEAWEECRRLRAYLGALRHAAEKKGPLDAGGPLAEWIRWAEGYVEAADPMNSLEELAFDAEEAVARSRKFGGWWDRR